MKDISDIFVFVVCWLLGLLLFIWAKQAIQYLWKHYPKLTLYTFTNIVAMIIVMSLLGYFDFILYTEK